MKKVLLGEYDDNYSLKIFSIVSHTSRYSRPSVRCPDKRALRVSGLSKHSISKCSCRKQGLYKNLGLQSGYVSAGRQNRILCRVPAERSEDY